MRRCVLLMGTSPAYHHRPGEPPLGPLVAEQLEILSSRHSWSVVTEKLFFRPNTIERAGRLVDRHRPDLVVLVLDAGVQMMKESVEYRIRRRWPYLYRPFAAMSRRAFAIAGGERRAQNSWRNRLLFSGPRKIVYALIGAETDVPQESATALQVQTMQMLVDRRIPFVCRLSVFPHVPDADDPAASGYEERARTWRETHMHAVIRFCKEHRVPFYDPVEQLDGRFSFDTDRLHPSFESRRLDAELIASKLTALVDA